MLPMIRPFAGGMLAAALLAAPLVAPVQAQASQLQILYRFAGQGDGADPIGAPVIGRDGALFGLASKGGPGNGGVLYSLRPNGGGSWNETVVHAFPPPSSGVLLFPSLTPDAAGDLFGTDTRYPTGAGDVFEVARPKSPDGAWPYHVLARFPGSSSPLGDFLTGRLLIDRQGDIIGVASAGGDESGQYPCDCGLVYSLSRPSGSGPWPETVLSVFHSIPDADTPLAGLTYGPGGALYGVTSLGGTSRQCRDGSGVVVVGCGALYRLNGAGSNPTRTDLYSFTLAPPSQPTDSLTFGPDGALYGFATLAAYRFAPPGTPGGRWYPGIIHAFPGGIAGTSPIGAPVFDAKGNLYGMTRSFGLNGHVTLFELSPPSSNPNGPWRMTRLHKFPGVNFAGQPAGGVAIGPDGTLYGAIGADLNGANGYVFSYKP